MGDANAFNSINAINGGSLINVNNTIRGAGTIGANILDVDNQWLIVADGINTLTLDPAAVFTNTGTIRAENNATLVLSAGTFANTGGVIEAQDGSMVILSSAVIDGGTLHTSGSGVFQTTGIETLDGSANILTNAATINVLNGDDLNLRGTIMNTATINLNSTSVTTELQADGGVVLLAGGGTVNMGDANAFNSINQINGGSLTNVDNTIQGAGTIGLNSMSFTNQGTVIASGDNALTIDPPAAGSFTNEGDLQATGAGGLIVATGPFTTSGTVTIAAGSSLSRTGDYTQTSGLTMVQGTLSATGIVDLQGGVLRGDGTVVGDVINDGATVEPGSSAGELQIDGDFTQTTAGMLHIELGGTLDGEFDVLTVAGTADLDGELHVIPIDGFLPQVGQQFVILTADALAEAFSAVTGPGPVRCDI